MTHQWQPHRHLKISRTRPETLTEAEITLQAQFDATAATRATGAGYDLAYATALLDTVKGSLDRSRAAAELVQKAAAAIGTLYVGVLGVSFSVSSRPLPPRGFFPAIFFGLAVTLSTFYVAYLTAPDRVELDAVPTSPPERMNVRLRNYSVIIQRTVERRAYALRASVIALGVGVFLLPAPFVRLSTNATPSAQSSYAWPTPPAVATEPAANLEAIVFKAQVDEVAALRQRAHQLAENDLGPWQWETLGILLVAVFALALINKPPTIVADGYRHLRFQIGRIWRVATRRG